MLNPAYNLAFVYDWREAFTPPTWSNWGLVLIGLIVSLVGIRSLRMLTRQTKATETAANAAKSSAETAEQSLRLTQSPVIAIESASIFPSTGEIKVRLRNYGGTAAHNVIVIPSVGDNSKRDILAAERVGPFAFAANATPNLVLGRVRITKDSNGQVSAVCDVRCSLDLVYDDVFRVRHRKQYALLFNRYTLTAKVEAESEELS